MRAADVVHRKVLALRGGGALLDDWWLCLLHARMQCTRTHARAYVHGHAHTIQTTRTLPMCAHKRTRAHISGRYGRTLSIYAQPCVVAQYDLAAHVCRTHT